MAVNHSLPATRMKIAVGPLLFGWPEVKIREFYLSLAEDSDVDMLYLGEVVCSKRIISGVEWQIRLAQKLQESGKEVVLSTLAMPTTENELQSIRDLVSAAREMGLIIEANDMASVAIASKLGVEFVAGSHLNIYSHGTLEQMCRQGAKRVILPLASIQNEYCCRAVVIWLARGKNPGILSVACRREWCGHSLSWRSGLLQAHDFRYRMAAQAG